MKNILYLLLPILFISCDTENNNDYALIETWELVKYEDTTEDTIENAPENEKPVTITFKENTFVGSTGNNEFFGDYKIESSRLILIGGGVTEVTDTPWGHKFYYERLLKNYSYDDNNLSLPFSLNNNTLKLEYDTSQFMVFTKI